MSEQPPHLPKRPQARRCTFNVKKMPRCVILCGLAVEGECRHWGRGYEGVVTRPHFLSHCKAIDGPRMSVGVLFSDMMEPAPLVPLVFSLFPLLFIHFTVIPIIIIFTCLILCGFFHVFLVTGPFTGVGVLTAPLHPPTPTPLGGGPKTFVYDKRRAPDPASSKLMMDITASCHQPAP